VFYLMLSALFLGGVHRRSNRYALVFAAAAAGLGGVLVPGSLSYDLLTPGVVVAITDSLVRAGLVLTLAGRGRTRVVGARRTAWRCAAAAVKRAPGAYEALPHCG
jgi:DNA-binding transcriptional LysR family regulator